jgi:signal peptidase I
MEKEKIKKIENNIISITLALILAYIIGSFVFEYELSTGLLLRVIFNKETI